MNRALIFAAFLFLPLAVLASKGETVLLLVTAVISIVGIEIQSLRHMIFQHSSYKVLFAVAAISALSVFWAIDINNAIKLLPSLIVLFIAAAIIFSLSESISTDHRNSFLKWMWIGFGLGAGLLALELLLEFPILRAVTGKPREGPGSPHVGILGPAFSVMVLMLWPLISSAWHQIRGNTVPAFLAVFMLTIAGSHLASIVALILSTFVFFIVRLAGDRVVKLLTAITAIFILFVPLIAGNYDPEHLADHFSADEQSALHRLYIWEFTSDKILEKPILGWGLDASRSIPGAGLEVLPSGPVLSLHPHNAALQLWQ